jgi:hypothetical protein
MEVHQVAWSGKSYSNSKKGFTNPEMAFLLLVLALFLTGTVWVVNTAIAKSHLLGKSDRVGSEVERALDRVEAMVRTARVFDAPGKPVRAGAWTPGENKIEFLGDIDGDANTGSYVVGEQTGLELVSIARRGNSLVASVLTTPGAAARAVVLLTDLSPADPEAFASSFHVEKSRVTMTLGMETVTVPLNGHVTGEMQVSIVTVIGGSHLVFGRSIGLPQRPAVISAGGIL